MNIFKPDYERYEGVRPINIYLLRLLFLLMAVFVLSDAGLAIVKHQGEWQPVRAAALCMWAAYSLVSILGIFHPLRLIPIVLFEIVYKIIWLAVVAWPLWSTNRLVGSPAEEMTYAFLWVVLPIVAMPWGYAFRTLVLNRKVQEQRILVA
ncbi:MAG TPA: hypothetical protein VGF48_15740 [Thermoanaerobaculia bacterium]|jgi:hypothetical protein